MVSNEEPWISADERGDDSVSIGRFFNANAKDTARYIAYNCVVIQ